ncbi:hypothetical protein N5B55_05325 [Ralstonia pickettii]|uniref:hypothetical protein n=1 Tax=Ralstonia pickettii TaxID=329 RepID=UPI0027147EC8|nr:hypothetical protein [Ralstonia pickettii]WKZ86377.1 hypothetical protein N5B55_05325 [Ralstonia pickettii]
MSQIVELERLHPNTRQAIAHDLRCQVLLSVVAVRQQKAELECKRGLFGAMLREHVRIRQHEEARPGWGSW